MNIYVRILLIISWITSTSMVLMASVLRSVNVCEERPWMMGAQNHLPACSTEVQVIATIGYGLLVIAFAVTIYAIYKA